MPRIPLEDNFTDVLGKAQRGYHLSSAALAAAAGLSEETLTGLQAGEVNEPALRAVARPLRLRADALVALARGAWYPDSPIFRHGFAMFHTRYEDMGVNSYLVWDERTREAAAFDTGADAGPLLDFVAAEHLKLHYIFLTHTHEDHVADLARLAGTGAQVWASELEPSDHPGARTFRENAHFHLGKLAIKTLFTWGHSPGMTTYYLTGLTWPLAIVGDAIFSSSMGGSATHFETQLRHNREKILTLPADTVLACGHGPLTTLKQEKRHNPFFP